MHSMLSLCMKVLLCHLCLEIVEFNSTFNLNLMDTFSVLSFTLFSPILGLGMSKKFQPTVETNVKFSDVKGVDEAKAELEEIVHFLKDPEVDFSGINLWSLLHAFLALQEVCYSLGVEMLNQSYQIVIILLLINMPF